MLEDEYYLEASFPYNLPRKEGEGEEEKEPGFRARTFDLFPWPKGSQWYWKPKVRMYVRKCINYPD